MISGDLDERADPELLQRCADFFLENGQFDKAVDLLGIGKKVNAQSLDSSRSNTRVGLLQQKPDSRDVMLNDVFGSFFFLTDFFNIYIRCRKFNAEFNKLITIGHRARFFETMMLNKPLPRILTLFRHFHIVTYQVLKL